MHVLPSFRSFGVAATLLIAAAGGGCSAAGPTEASDQTTEAAGSRGYVAGKYGLELDGVSAGWIWSVEGGHATSDVVTETQREPALIHKHIGGVKYEDITMTLGAGMSKAFYDWVTLALNGVPSAKSGRIAGAGADDVQEFRGGLITEIGFPALDAASKDAAKMTVKFAPEFTRFGNASAKGGAALSPSSAPADKLWSPANFRFSIDGLDAATARVNKIDALTVKQSAVQDDIGAARDYAQSPNGGNLPHLVATFPEEVSAELSDWAARGADAGARKCGTLEYLGPDRKPLFRLNFQGLGIFKLAPEKVEAGSENIRRVKAEFTVDSVTLDASGARLP